MKIIIQGVYTFAIVILAVYVTSFVKTVFAGSPHWPYSAASAECSSTNKVVKKGTNAVLEDCARLKDENGNANCDIQEVNGELVVGCFTNKTNPAEVTSSTITTPSNEITEPTSIPTPASKPTPYVRPDPSICPEKLEEYPQCGQTTGLEDKDPTHTYIVTKTTDCHDVARFKIKEDKDNIHQCKEVTCKGETKTWEELDAELRGANYNGSFDHSQEELDAYNRAACPKILQAVKYKVAANKDDLKKAEWQPYIAGGVTVSVPSPIFKISSGKGPKTIYAQFVDSNDQMIKFKNGNDFVMLGIDLTEEGVATIETTPNVSGTNRVWQPTSIKVTLSGFEKSDKSVAAVFVKQEAGECTVKTCSFLGWTQIKTYGTNGTDQFNWIPNGGDLSEGIHAFGVFSLNPDGTAQNLLGVSLTNYLSK